MEDQRSLTKLMHFTRGISIFLLVCNGYIFCYAFFKMVGLTHPWIEMVLMRMAGEDFLQHSYLTKLFSFALLAISCMGVAGNQTDEITWKKTMPYLIWGPILFFGADLLLDRAWPLTLKALLYLGLSAWGFIKIVKGGNYVSRILKDDSLSDIFNKNNQSFPQEERCLENKYSVNIPTEYILRGRKRKGWINVVNPFRGALVLGTPGAGKSFVFINAYIKQLMAKGFGMYIYDYKYPDLSKIAYNTLRKNTDKYEKLYGVKPQFYVINFDNPSQSHRCNPLNPKFMYDIFDATECASMIMLNLNREWIKKQGEFFVESAISFVAANIWFLRLYKDGKYCTFPHLVEFLSASYDDIFPILGSYPEIEAIARPYVSAHQKGAVDQLEGQIASARIGLARLVSPQLYWTTSGDDFTLDLNNPKSPKILCVANNPDRQTIYGAALGLYNARIIKIINKQGRIPCAVIVDELATIFFKGIDNLIATARSNKVATLLGFQDFSQLDRDYGKSEAEVIQNTPGNLFCGQVVGETARKMQERFGKVNQRKQSVTNSQNGTSTSISTQMDYAIPASVLANLSQGEFVGSVADDRGQEIAQKMFHARAVVDVKKLEKESKDDVVIPNFRVTEFVDPETGEDITQKRLQENFLKIKKDVKNIIADELNRIRADEELCHLIKAEK